MQNEELTKEQVEAMNEEVDILIEFMVPFLDAYYELACILVDLQGETVAK